MYTCCEVKRTSFAISKNNNILSIDTTRYGSSDEITGDRISKDRLTKRWVKSIEVDADAPIQRRSWPRLSKTIGAKANSHLMAWRQGLKLDRTMWPHGYRGRKDHVQNLKNML